MVGEVVMVTPRLDARYDWLPSPHNLIHKHTHLNIALYGEACDMESVWEQRQENDEDEEEAKELKGKVSEGRIALVSPGGCSFFTKVTATLFDLDIVALSAYLLVQITLIPMTAEPEFLAKHKTDRMYDLCCN